MQDVQGTLVTGYSFNFKAFTVEVKHNKPEGFGQFNKGTFDVQVYGSGAEIVFAKKGCLTINNLCYAVQDYFLTTDHATLNARTLFFSVEFMRSTLEADLEQAIFWKQHNEFVEKMKEFPVLALHRNKDLVEAETVKFVAQKTRLGKESIILNEGEWKIPSSDMIFMHLHESNPAYAKVKLKPVPVISEDCHEDWAANAHRHPQLY